MDVSVTINHESNTVVEVIAGCPQVIAGCPQAIVEVPAPPPTPIQETADELTIDEIAASRIAFGLMAEALWDTEPHESLLWSMCGEHMWNYVEST